MSVLEMEGIYATGEILSLRMYLRWSLYIPCIYSHTRRSYRRRFRSLLLCPLSVERYYFPLFVDFTLVHTQRSLMPRNSTKLLWQTRHKHFTHIASRPAEQNDCDACPHGCDTIWLFQMPIFCGWLFNIFSLVTFIGPFYTVPDRVRPKKKEPTTSNNMDNIYRYPWNSTNRSSRHKLALGGSIYTEQRTRKQARVPVKQWPTHIMGKMISSTAFSWTCQPNMKEAKAQRTTVLTNPTGPLGFHHIWPRAGWNNRVLSIINNWTNTSNDVLKYTHKQQLNCTYM